MSRYLPQVFLLSALVLNATANILIKYSATRIPGLPQDAGRGAHLMALLQPAFILGLALFAMNVFAYQAALRTLKLSVAYPIMVSGGYLIILMVSWFLFNERLNPAQYAGIGLILGGIWLVVR